MQTVPELLGDKMKALMVNGKTIRSFDLSTVCEKQQQGKGCPYCYVNSKREIKDARAKAICFKTSYNGEILRLKQKTVERLNKIGGLRLFAFGDYVNSPEADNIIEQLIDDCRKRGLKIKAVTKRLDFVEKYVLRIDCINLSVDSIGSGVDLNKALELKQRFPSVIKIRAVALNENDFENWRNKKFVDIITLYHGPRKNYNGVFFKPLRKTDFSDNRICSGKCLTCLIKCGENS